jgi:hypothetical protein
MSGIKITGCWLPLLAVLVGWVVLIVAILTLAHCPGMAL